MRRALPVVTLLALAFMLAALASSSRPQITPDGPKTPLQAPQSPPSQPLPGEPLPHRVLVTEKTLPPHQERKSASTIFRLAEDAARYQELWALYGLQGEPPNVDWEQEAVLFVGTGESGSCPLRLSGMALDRRAGLLTVAVEDRPAENPNLAPKTGLLHDCTDDYTPRTFVVAVPANDLPGGILRAVLHGAFNDPPESLRDEGHAAPSLPGWKWVLHDDNLADDGTVSQIEVLTHGERITVQVTFAGSNTAYDYDLNGLEFNNHPLSEVWENRATHASDQVTLAFPGRLGLEPDAAAEVPFDHHVLKSVRVTEDPDRSLVLFQIKMHRKVGPDQWYASHSQNIVGVILR